MQSNLGIVCSSTYTTVSTDSVSGQRRPRSACAYAPMHRLIWARVVRKLYKVSKLALCIMIYILADCGEPIEPENGAVSTNGGTTIGHIAQYGCDDGYELSGPSTRICKPDGAWSDSEPTCDPICKL